MFNNVGRLIKMWAKFSFWLKVLVCAGVVVLLNRFQISNSQVLQILICAFGPVVAWLSSLVLYGFGQIVENTDFLADKMSRVVENTDILADKVLAEQAAQTKDQQE